MSEEGKKAVYSFGDPDVDAIVSRFVEQQQQTSPPPHDLLPANIQQLCGELVSMHDHLEMEKKASEELRKKAKSSGNWENYMNYWWDGPQNLGVEELQQVKATLLKFKEELIEIQQKQIQAEAAAAAAGDTAGSVNH